MVTNVTRIGIGIISAAVMAGACWKIVPEPNYDPGQQSPPCNTNYCGSYLVCPQGLQCARAGILDTGQSNCTNGTRTTIPVIYTNGTYQVGNPCCTGGIAGGFSTSSTCTTPSATLTGGVCAIPYPA